MGRKKGSTPKAKVRTVYELAPDVKDVAEELIEDRFHGLKDAVIEYRARTRERDGVAEPSRALDARSWGKVSCASPSDQQVKHTHFRIEINGNWWEMAKPEDRRAAVSHLLRHCWLTEGRPRLLQHDVSGVFVAELEEDGPWSKELKDLVNGISQLKMVLDGADAAKAASAPAPAKATG